MDGDRDKQGHSDGDVPFPRGVVPSATVAGTAAGTAAVTATGWQGSFVELGATGSCKPGIPWRGTNSLSLQNHVLSLTGTGNQWSTL